VRPAGGWATTSSPNGELTADDGAANDALGSSVAVAGDTIVSGAPTRTVGINAGQGAAYVFTRPAPSITIASPRNGASYIQGQSVRAAFTCADDRDGSGLASCAGTTADGATVDTSIVGRHAFTVTATDTAGEQRTEHVEYTVVPRTLGIAAPTISRFTQSHRIWREGAKPASISRARAIPVGTTFSFVLDRTARVAFAFAKRTVGRTVGGRCVALTRTNRTRSPCRRALAAGTLTFAGHPGTDAVSFQGRISRHRRLRPGPYTVSVTATDSAGRHSKPRRLAFTIVG
jgi:hypothetical protein